MSASVETAGEIVRDIDEILSAYKEKMTNRIDGHLLKLAKNDEELNESLEGINIHNRLHRRRHISEYHKIKTICSTQGLYYSNPPIHF